MLIVRSNFENRQKRKKYNRKKKINFLALKDKDKIIFSIWEYFNKCNSINLGRFL